MKKESKAKPVIKPLIKANIIAYVGEAPEIKRKLDYEHRNVVYGWKDELSVRQSKDVIRRMKAARITVPKEWL